MKNSEYHAFDNDVTLNGGYLYTTNAILSSKMANERLTKATIDIIDLKGKTVIDVGCGDGTYTYELYKWCKPKHLVGVDAARNAIKLAQVLYHKEKGIKFVCENIYNLPKKLSVFDVAIVRGVIHHVDHPQKAIESLAKIAKEIVILDPNGYNPLLKIVEKVSLYHRTHKEKSYSPVKIRGWLTKTRYGIVKDDYVGFVPFFCPDGMAIALKKVEKYIENFPLFSRFLCAVYVVYAKKV